MLYRDFLVLRDEGIWMYRVLCVVCVCVCVCVFVVCAESSVAYGVCFMYALYYPTSIDIPAG
jgi:hypothetical protein